MPDPYTFPPGDQPEDDPVRPVAGPDGGEQGSNEHGAGSEYVMTTPTTAQGGGQTMATPGALPDTDPELGHDTFEPKATAYTPATVHVATVITITGKGLGDVTAATVGGVAVVGTTITASDTSVVLTVPAGVANGAAAVVLTSRTHGLIVGPNVTVS